MPAYRTRESGATGVHSSAKRGGNFRNDILLWSIALGSRSQVLAGLDLERSVQIDIELVRAVAADQRQFQRRAFRIDAGRYAVELDRKALHAGRAVL